MKGRSRRREGDYYYGDDVGKVGKTLLNMRRGENVWEEESWRVGLV